jgi:hypothetical protein
MTGGGFFHMFRGFCAFCAVVLSSLSAYGAVFDLRNLGGPIPSQIIVDGIRMRISGEGSTMVSTPTTFGLDGTGTNDSSTLR